MLLSAAEIERVWRWEVSLLFSSIKSIGESCRDGAFERSVGVNNAIGCRGIFNWLKLEAMNVGGIGCATGALVIGGEGADTSTSIGAFGSLLGSSSSKSEGTNGFIFFIFSSSSGVKASVMKGISSGFFLIVSM